VTIGIAPEVHAAIEVLKQLSDLFAERRAQLAGSVGLTEQQWSVLEGISAEHFMPSLFARQRESSAAAVSKILRQLLDKKLVRVHLSPEDGRQRRYELTATGHKILSSLAAERERAISAIWKGFSSVELQRFISFGERLTEQMTAFVQAFEQSE
jgi:DNA-binding MarR family transcriptional regulator